MGSIRWSRSPGPRSDHLRTDRRLVMRRVARWMDGQGCVLVRIVRDAGWTGLDWTGMDWGGLDWGGMSIWCVLMEQIKTEAEQVEGDKFGTRLQGTPERLKEGVTAGVLRAPVSKCANDEPRGAAGRKRSKTTPSVRFSALPISHQTSCTSRHSDDQARETALKPTRPPTELLRTGNHDIYRLVKHISLDIPTWTNRRHQEDTLGSFFSDDTPLWPTTYKHALLVDNRTWKPAGHNGDGDGMGYSGYGELGSCYPVWKRKSLAVSAGSRSSRARMSSISNRRTVPIGRFTGCKEDDAVWPHWEDAWIG